MTRSTTMRGLRHVVTGLALAVIASAATPASAGSGCILGCNVTKKECIQTGRIDKLACKLECRETAAPGELGACARACADTYRTTKREVCRPDHRSCREGCVPDDGGDPDPCLIMCGEGLATCARAVVSEGRACVQGCRTDPDRLGCLTGCAADAEAGAARCEGEFSSCASGCGGSPDGAFPQPPRRR